MTKAIWKFAWPQPGEVGNIALPPRSQIVHVDVQYDNAYFWAIVDPKAEDGPGRTFYVAGTGHGISRPFEYIGTVQIRGYVWHLLELLDSATPA